MLYRSKDTALNCSNMTIGLITTDATMRATAVPYCQYLRANIDQASVLCRVCPYYNKKRRSE